MIFVIPGYGGSGPQHWQSIWEAGDPALMRIDQRDWDAPVLTDWQEVARDRIASAKEPAILLAHSLGCLLVPHLAADPALAGQIAGAFLVAVPDPAGPNFPQDALPFGQMPAGALGFPSLIIASTTDDYGSLEHSRARAHDWGSRLVDLGDCGHINIASGHGHWPEGRRLFDAFLAGLGR